MSELASDVAQGKVAFGINHEMRDFSQNRKKNLDLVLCTPASGVGTPAAQTLLQQSDHWMLALNDDERADVARLPTIRRAPVGNVLVALEAKACMTAHQKALPRLYDELNSSHLTVHGAAENAIAVGLVFVNAAGRYVSPDKNKRVVGSEPTWSNNPQPKSAEITVAKVKELPRRSGSTGQGYDALAIVVLDFANDGSTVGIVNRPPAPDRHDIFDYARMVERLSGAYATRFRDI